MWMMLLIAGTILRMAGEGLPPDGCATAKEWWAKHDELWKIKHEPTDPELLRACRYYLKRDAEAFFNGLYDFVEYRDTNPWGPVNYRPRIRIGRGNRIDSPDRFNREYAKRIFVARLLGALGPSAQEGVPLLKKLLLEDDLRMKVIAADALWKVEKNPEVVAILLRVLDHTTLPELKDSKRTKEETVRAASFSVPVSGTAPYWEKPLPLMWGEPEPETPPWTRSPALAPYWEHPLPLVWGEKSDGAFISVEHVCYATPTRHSPFILEGWMLWPQPVAAHEARLTAIEVLGEVGAPAASAAPLLKKLMYDLDSEIACAAGCALWKINQSPEAVIRIRLMCHENPMLYLKVQVMMPEMVRDFERKQNEQSQGEQNVRMIRF